MSSLFNNINVWLVKAKSKYALSIAAQSTWLAGLLAGDVTAAIGAEVAADLLGALRADSRLTYDRKQVDLNT
jgi:hypothetical protein